MSEKPTKEDSQERISELEQEVQRLRSALEKKEVAEADADAVEAVRREGLTPNEQDAAAAEQLAPPRSRLIMWGILAGALALGGVLLITMMLASGFNFLGKRVANTVYPDEDTPGAIQPRGNTKGAPVKPGPKEKKGPPPVEFQPPGL